MTTLASRTLSLAERNLLLRRIMGPLSDWDGNDPDVDYEIIAETVVDVVDEFLEGIDLSAQAPGGAFE